MTKYILCVIFGLSILFLSGCAKNLPDDLPKLYPCKITILCKGEPLAEATVGLVPAEGKWDAVGRTDATGTVDMKTRAAYNGVPAGAYKVIVTKYKVISRSGVARSDSEDSGNGEAEEVPLVDKSFMTGSTTPLELVVEEKNSNTKTFEVW